MTIEDIKTDKKIIKIEIHKKEKQLQRFLINLLKTHGNFNYMWKRDLLPYEKARCEQNKEKIMMKFSYKPEDE